MTDISWQRRPYPLGAEAENRKIRFSFVSKKDSCGILLFDRTTGKRLHKIPFSPEERIGNVYCKTIDGVDAAKVTYQFYVDEKVIPDQRARVFPGKAVYGKERPWSDLKAGFLTENFDWEQDQFPLIPYHQVVAYCMHVRGFTKHTSSAVKNRGTFAGIVEKIPYLKEIGVTTIELQPAYEFAEIPAEEELLRELPYSIGLENVDGLNEKKVNYWGYKRGYYYAPKAAYSAAGDPTVEFKEMVKALHKNEIELVMQFYFPREVKRSEISEVLRFWVLEYHVDGFHLMGEDMPSELLASDDVLAETKLWYYQFQTDSVFGREEQPRYTHIAEYNDAWYYDMRRFLKGDEGMLGSVLYHMRHIPEKAGCVHYLTNYSGFTLADLVSYDYKHNEENGENNRDGNDYNCSWNCGEEGTTRRQKVRQLRTKQIKNAMCLLMLSQSTPLIFMGDEFGNSQRGNNNPYCQDNGITWLNWNDQKKNGEIFEFWKQLVTFRESHPILHPERELRLMDYLSCGYPDLSYHGQSAWKPETEGYFRHVGILLCEKYAKAEEDVFVYLALNMHWESHELALPRLPKGLVWSTAFYTEPAPVSGSGKQAASAEELVKKIPPRSIAVYVSEPDCKQLSKTGGKKLNVSPKPRTKQKEIVPAKPKDQMTSPAENVHADDAKAARVEEK